MAMVVLQAGTEQNLSLMSVANLNLRAAKSKAAYRSETCGEHLKLIACLGLAAELQKTHTLFTFCSSVRKIKPKQNHTKHEFQKNFALHLLTSKLKAVHGIKPKQNDLCNALVSKTLQCHLSDTNLEHILACIFPTPKKSIPRLHL